MSIEELEKKPKNEWTPDEVLFWLQEYAKDMMMAELCLDKDFING